MNCAFFSHPPDFHGSSFGHTRCTMRYRASSRRFDGRTFWMKAGSLLTHAVAPEGARRRRGVRWTSVGAVFTLLTGLLLVGPAAGVPRNRPIAGVTATAYDADGDQVGTATSAADGTYTIDAAGARSQDLRIEFSGWDQEVYQ